MAIGKMKVCFGITTAIVLCLTAAWPLRANAGDWLSYPHRERLSFGLDPGFTLADVDKSQIPRLLRVNIRGGWCVTPWFVPGGDFTMDFLMDDAGAGHFFGPKILQPMATFFPVAGFFLRAGLGYDPYDMKRWTATGAAGYEFGFNKYGGVGFGFVFSQLWHTDERPDWRLYNLTIVLTGYQVDRGFPGGDD